MQLEGVYSVLPTAFTAAGDLDDDSLRRGEMWVITEDSILMHAKNLGANAYAYLHRLDAGQDPKQIDIKRTDGVAIEAIYKLDDDTFTICVPAEGKPRPREFSGKAGTEQKLHVWKKVKQ